MEEKRIIINKEMTACSSKKSYKKTLTKTMQPKASVIFIADGNLLTENATFLNRCGEYCSDI